MIWETAEKRMIAIEYGVHVCRDGSASGPGVVLVDGGKIKDVGPDVPIPEGAEVVDASACWVSPGIIEPHCHVCCDAGSFNEMSDPVTPEMQARDTFYPFSRWLPLLRQSGITTFCLLPGSANLFGGTGWTAKLRHGTVPEDFDTKAGRPIKMALGDNPISAYSKRGRLFSRMGNAVLMRSTLLEAQAYMHERESRPEMKRNMKWEALLPLLRGEVPARVHVHRADDMVKAVELSEEFGYRLILEHCDECWMIKDWLAAKKIPFCLGPLYIPGVKPEMRNISMDCAAEMEEAGCFFALTTDGYWNVSCAPYMAGTLTAYGLSREYARRAITIHAAQILGMDAYTGSLERGKDADLAIFTGDPLVNKSRCVATMVDGEFVYREEGLSCRRSDADM